MSSRLRIFIGSAAVIAGLATGSPAVAATLEVDDNRAQCPRASFRSIQAAVDASGPGDTVLVCDGSYAGGVRIAGAQHSGLRLLAKTPGRANITGVGVVPDLTGVLVDGGAFDVEVSRFVIDGPKSSTGIFTGTGIHVENESGASRIVGNAVRGEMGGGISIAGRAAFVSRNTIVGYTGAGIVVAGPADVVSENRTFSRSPIGIGLMAFEGARGLFTDNMTAGDGHGVGIVAEGSGAAGRPTLDQVLFRRNTVQEHDIGIRLNDAIGARFELNRVTNGRIGIKADATAFGNRFVSNVVLGNSEVDCRDEPLSPGAAIDNTWIGNRGRTSDPPGLCTP